jgi:uncharacterized membrane protein YccC
VHNWTTRGRELRSLIVTISGDPTNAVRIAGRELKPVLKRLLACIADIEADGRDIDWVRLPKRHASAVLTDIEANLADAETSKEAARRVELLGNELALRLWGVGDSDATEFDTVASRLLALLSRYRAHLRALSSGEPAI